MLYQGEVGGYGISFNGGLFRYDPEDVRELRLGQVSSRKPRTVNPNLRREPEVGSGECVTAAPAS